MIVISHKVCQDYALHSQKKIILCDGCSSVPLKRSFNIPTRIVYSELLNFKNYTSSFLQRRCIRMLVETKQC